MGGAFTTVIILFLVGVLLAVGLVKWMPRTSATGFSQKQRDELERSIRQVKSLMEEAAESGDFDTHSGAWVYLCHLQATQQRGEIPKSEEEFPPDKAAWAADISSYIRSPEFADLRRRNPDLVLSDEDRSRLNLSLSRTSATGLSQKQRDELEQSIRQLESLKEEAMRSGNFDAFRSGQLFVMYLQAILRGETSLPEKPLPPDTASWAAQVSKHAAGTWSELGDTLDDKS